MRRFALTVLLLSIGPTVRAEDVNQTFGLYVSGLKAGSIQIKGHLSGTMEQGQYALEGALSPTSVMRHFHDVGYSGVVQGQMRDGQIHPVTYHSHTRTESRENEVKLQFTGASPDAAPVVEMYAPSREHRDYDIDPAAQNGVLDPLSAAHLVFRDQGLGDLCNKVIDVFDGRRRTRLTLDAPVDTGQNTICTGAYSRIAGFSPEDMQEQVNFPFTLVYTKGDADTYILSSFTTETSFGSAEAARK